MHCGQRYGRRLHRGRRTTRVRRGGGTPAAAGPARGGRRGPLPGDPYSHAAGHTGPRPGPCRRRGGGRRRCRLSAATGEARGGIQRVRGLVLGPLSSQQDRGLVLQHAEGKRLRQVELDRRAIVRRVAHGKIVATVSS